ncbi:hypothetical protein FOCC_FOCC002710 [Frankliniella occidentalis]|uniref:F-box/WD repeat-containing protein 9 n=1 Tax=Frankliniella occidentalis TaxID=133901 RepID=A0A6J1SKT2_FRAOC|nr:F-box/WD repeat-containing protein 9 [Frankliniella occidentalis]XP_026279151.1 F-box/WD repeat-containing protein 9 [Frankliniella occidentalis]KAE8750416.1 hypothetical protein FOCC_FOCC002710 [Frankliniella occidentalis]
MSLPGDNETETGNHPHSEKPHCTETKMDPLEQVDCASDFTDETDKCFLSMSIDSEEQSLHQEICEIPPDLCPETLRITLTDLPTEVFLQVCSYLSARLLMQTMRLVNKRLNEILSDDFIWRSRIFKRWRQVYPPLPAVNNCVNWKAACINLEEQQERWSNMQSTMKHLSWRDLHVASIDAIMLINRGALCVSGSRDRSLAVWDVNASNPCPITHIEAHKGWIWGLAAKSDSSFYTCSWDCTAKLWTLEDGRLTASDTFKSKTAMLCVACKPNLVAVGSFDKRVLLWDPRSGSKPIHSYTPHRRAVLKLCLLEESGIADTVVSISEDQTFAVWDIRAGKLLKENVKIGPSDPESTAFPMCMSLNSDMLYIGDSKNRLHLVDPRRDSPTRFEIIASYDAGHKDQCKITAVRHGLGCVITGSSDGTVRVSTPTHHPELITSFTTVGTEVAAIDFQHGILAVGCTNCAVELWIPTQDIPT